MHFETGIPADYNDEPEVAATKNKDTDLTVIWAAPILPGKAEAWRRFMQELMGDRRQDFNDVCRRLEILAMRSWITETAQRDFGVIAVIASQPKQIMAYLSASDLPFDHWFRSQLAVLQGLDIGGPPRMPPSDLVLDWSSSTDSQKEGGDR